MSLNVMTSNKPIKLSEALRANNILSEVEDLLWIDHAPEPRTIVTSEGATGYHWTGIIIGREWGPGFTEQDYLDILRAGKTRPDGYDQNGRPQYQLSSVEWKQVERDLDRLCLGGYQARVVFSNVACNAGRSVVLQFITNVGGLTGVQYFAVGTGTGTPTSTDTQLSSEFFRKAITSTSISGNQANLSTFFATTDANTTYSEAGIFGNGATGTANSGALFGHATYVYTKTSSVSLTNSYYVTLS